MKKITLLKSFLLLCALIVGSNSLWADNITYTFSSKAWAADNGNWTSGQDGSQKNATQGVQVTTTTTGANATSPISFNKISSIVVTYSTNASTGAGSISFKVGDGAAKSQVVTTSGGTTDRTLRYDFSPTETGAVTMTITCTTNSIYIKSVTIFYAGPSEYSIDFETTDLSTYSDWTFTNIVLHNEKISSHSGEKWGATDGKATATIQSNNKISSPGVLTFYVSKESDNTTASTWAIHVSDNGSSWGDPVKSADAATMGKGEWVKVTADLTSYTNKYVRISYGSSTAVRAIDDITLTLANHFTLAAACTDGSKYYGTFCSGNAFIVPEDLTVSAVGIDNEGKLVVNDYSTGDIVKANTGVMVSATTSGNKTVFLSSETGTEKDGNLLKPSGDAGITAANMNEANTQFYRLTMHNGTQIGFWWGAAEGAAFDLAANKAYLAVPNDAMSSARTFMWFGEGETTAINEIKKMRNVDNENFYNLNGQKVGQPTKGLYIVNGKKVVIK